MISYVFNLMLLFPPVPDSRVSYKYVVTLILLQSYCHKVHLVSSKQRKIENAESLFEPKCQTNNR